MTVQNQIWGDSLGNASGPALTWRKCPRYHPIHSPLAVQLSSTCAVPMPTKLDKSMKREVLAGGQTLVLTLTPDVVTLTPKGKRKGKTFLCTEGSGPVRPSPLTSRASVAALRTPSMAGPRGRRGASFRRSPVPGYDHWLEGDARPSRAAPADRSVQNGSTIADAYGARRIARKRLANSLEVVRTECTVRSNGEVVARCLDTNVVVVHDRRW